MIEEMMSAYGGRLTIAVVGVGVALLCLVGILRFLRGRNGPSPFVRGGRNRNPRLQVLDAAAVDARRRLVLVRRDNVEHLVMIGGPTDIVIESGIATAPDSRPTAAPVASQSQPPLPDPRAAALAAQSRAARQNEPRGETRRDAIASEPVRSIAAPSAAPMKMEPIAASQPSAPARPASVAPQPAPRPQLTRPEPSADTPGIDEAAKALEAARGRGVLQDGIVQNRSAAEPVATEKPPAPHVVALDGRPLTQPAPERPATDKPRALGSDFEKILEEEMANNLAARDTTRLRIENQPSPTPANATPRQPDGEGTKTEQDARPAVEPTLQDQVARIFGEMSATRDK